MSKWTRFMDMHSGGGLKEPYGYIYIEAPEAEAKIILFNRFGHNPERVSCTCCGDDYSIEENESLEQATAFERGCAFAYINTKTGEEVSQDEAWVIGKGTKDGYEGRYVDHPATESYAKPYMTLEEWKQFGKGNIDGGVLFIHADEIQPEERRGEIPEQGYVWVD